MIHQSDALQRDRDLAARMREGDHGAFEELFNTYAEALCDFVWQFVQSEAVAEDLVQELFIRLWRRREDWRIETSVRSYLYKGARNLVYDYLRHQRVVRKFEVQVSHNGHHFDISADADLGYEELAEAVEKAIEQLPERRRLIFTMSRQHDLTYKEIAAVLGISVKTVETQMSLSFVKLRQLLSPYLSAVLLLLL